MQVELVLMSDGWCEQLEYIACRSGKMRRVRFASMFGLIKHPQLGPILFDTGYTRRFFTETSKFPARLYQMATPVHLEETGDVVMQLNARGIEAGEVRHVIISHFHADHVGGLKDFPNAQFHCFRSAFDSVKTLRGLGALRQAFLPGLLPRDFQERVSFADRTPVVRLSSSYKPFEEAHDLLGDGSLLAISLPGHAAGQMGILLTTTFGVDCLLAADACWLSRQYREFLMPHAIVRSLVDWSEYTITLQRLYQLHLNNPALRIIPTHCPEIWKGFS